MSRTATRRNPVSLIGARVLGVFSYAGGMSLLLGSTAKWAFRGMFTRKVRLGRQALAAQMVRVGVYSCAIVMLVQTFIGVILALQMAPPLKPLYLLSPTH